MADMDSKKTDADSLQEKQIGDTLLVSSQGNSLDGTGLSSEKALSKTGGAEILFYYFHKYEEELRIKNEEVVRNLESQRKN